MNWQAIAASMSGLGVLISALGILVSAGTAWRLQRDTAEQKRRSDLIPIWKEMLQISRIDPTNPNSDDVRTALNLLGLIAQCHDLKIVEQNVLKEMFKTVYVSVYKDIAAITANVTLGLTTQPGRDYLTNEPRVTALCNSWQAA